MLDQHKNTTRTHTSKNATVVGNGDFDQGGNRINLEICVNNAIGQTLHVQLSHEGRTWPVVTQQATTRCTTFYDLDGPGPVLFHTDYTTRAALNQDPNPNWPANSCAENSGWQGLCDRRSYP